MPKTRKKESMINTTWTKEYKFTYNDTEIIRLSSNKTGDLKYMVQNDRTRLERFFKESNEAENLLLKQISDQISTFGLKTRLLNKYKTEEWTSVLTFSDEVNGYSLHFQTRQIGINPRIEIQIIYVEDDEIDWTKDYNGNQFEAAENHFIRMAYEYLCSHSLGV